MGTRSDFNMKHGKKRWSSPCGKKLDRNKTEYDLRRFPFLILKIEYIVSQYLLRKKAKKRNKKNRRKTRK